MCFLLKTLIYLLGMRFISDSDGDLTSLPRLLSGIQNFHSVYIIMQLCWLSPPHTFTIKDEITSRHFRVSQVYIIDHVVCVPPPPDPSDHREVVDDFSQQTHTHTLPLVTFTEHTAVRSLW